MQIGFEHATLAVIRNFLFWESSLAFMDIESENKSEINGSMDAVLVKIVDNALFTISNM